MKTAVSSGLIAILVVAGACTRSPQQRAARFLASGKGYMQRHDYARAALQFRNAVAVLPKDAEPEYQLGLAYLADGKLTDAVTALVRATQLNPKHAQAQIQLAELMARSGIPSVVQDSRRRMQDVLAATPGNVEALNTIALAELQLGKPDDAERHLEEALQKFPNNLSSSVRLARLKLAQKDTRAAELALQQAAAAAPHSAPAATAVAALYTVLGRWPDAESWYRNALKIAPQDAPALLGLARAQMALHKGAEAEQTYRAIAQLPEPRYRHLHAAYLFAAGQRDAAIQELERIVKANPQDRDNRTRLAAAYLVSGRLTQAQKLLAAALKANPDDTDALLQRSLVGLQAGDDRQAEADLNQVLHYHPDSAPAHYLLAQVFRVRGRRDQAQAELDRALHLDPALLAARVQLAEMMTASHSGQGAVYLLDAAPGEQKHALPVVLARNWAKLAQGDTAAFRAGVREALQRQSTPELLVQDAAGKLLEHNYEAARESLRAALRENPQDLRALGAIAVSYSAQNQPAAAARSLQQYAGEHSNSAVLQEFVGEWLWNLGQRSEARKAFLAAKAISPDFVLADLALARVDLLEGNLPGARETLSRVLRQDGANVEALLLLASLESRAGNDAAAIAEYRQAVALRPNDPVILNNLAYLMARSGDRTDQALSFAQEAAAAMPDNPDAIGTLGWILYGRGLYQNALPYLEKAVSGEQGSTQPNAVIRQYHLAMTYLRLGNRKKGLEVLSGALRANPKLPEAMLAQAVAHQAGTSF